MSHTRYYTTMPSPLGEIVLTGNANGLTGVYLAKHDTAAITQNATRNAAPFKPAIQQLNEYFAGERRGFGLPLAPGGTEFQQRAWSALTTIRYGETRTYSEIAASVGNPKASRAVGMANHKNPLCIIIPCHRVIGANGKLTGYAGGLKVKEWLLRHEGAFA